MKCEICLKDVTDGNARICSNCENELLEKLLVEKNPIFIKGIKVRGLFNTFNYDINFKIYGGVSILIAPNGCGKTTIFNLIDFVLKPTALSCSRILEVPFDTFECLLSNGVSIMLKKKNIEKLADLYHGYILHFGYTINNNGNTEEIEIPAVAYKLLNRYILAVDESINGIEMINGLIYPNFKKIVDSNEKTTQQLFEKIRNKIEQITPKINYTRADRGVFNEVLQAEYVKNGAWTINYKSQQPFAEQTSMHGINKTKGLILSQYYDILNIKSKKEKEIQMFKHKAKISHFQTIYNERNVCTNKTIEFNENGFDILQNGNPIDLNFLSTGEKNDFMLLFELMFRSSEFGVSIIDEPEISLHIEWQETLLKHMSLCCAINNSQAIIATHSPSIIDGHLDVLADLEMIK